MNIELVATDLSAWSTQVKLSILPKGVENLKKVDH